MAKNDQEKTSHNHRWAYIYNKWTIVETFEDNDDTHFMCIGSDELCSPKDFEGFKWGDKITPPVE